MEPKLADAIRRYGFVESAPLGSAVAQAIPNGLTPTSIIHDEFNSCANGCHASDVYFGSWKRTEAERDALQELVTQRDMEIDYLATARPTTLRLDWYLILLSVVVHWAWWMWGR